MNPRHAIVPLALACAACGADQITLCSGAIIDPRSIPLAIGESTQVTASYELTNSCTPPAPLEELRWSSGDAAVASVDSITGVVTGVGPGTVEIAVRLAGTPGSLGTAQVVVFAPLFNRIVAIRERITCHDPSCSVWSGNGPIGIWTLATDGSDVRLLRELRYPDHPRVAPDGRRIVFDEWDTLYVMDGAGQAVRPLLTGLQHNWGASWSPDGRWILFAAGPVANKYQLHLIHPDGTGLRQLTDDPFGVSQAAWSPDGSTIAFVRDSMANNRQAGAARVMDTTGANIRVVSGDSTPFYGRLPEWSPDGTALVLINRPWVRRLVIATGQYDTLAAFDTNRPASWSPDSARIIVSGGDIRSLDPAKRYPNNGVPLLAGLGPDSMISWSAFYTPKP